MQFVACEKISAKQNIMTLSDSSKKTFNSAIKCLPASGSQISQLQFHGCTSSNIHTQSISDVVSSRGVKIKNYVLIAGN